MVWIGMFLGVLAIMETLCIVFGRLYVEMRMGRDN